MSSWLRLSIVMVLVLATVALGFIAYTASLPPKSVAQAPAIEQKAPASLGYYVAARPLPTGTLLHDEDFEVRAGHPGDVPSGAILESPDAKINLRGSLIRNFVEAGRPITSQDVLRPRDGGVVASLLPPGARAISINVDMESGVSGLISRGDYVDVVFTQTNDKERGRNSLSEIVVPNVMIVAVDPEASAGVSGANASAGRVIHFVTLQLSPEQVKKISLAKDLGKLSLAVRSAFEVKDNPKAGTLLNCDVSPAVASITTVIVYAKGMHEYTVKEQGIADARLASGCDKSTKIARTNAVASAATRGEKAKE